MGAGEKNNFLQSEIFQSCSRYQKVAKMKGIEGSAKQANPQNQKMLRSTWILSLGNSRISRLGST